MKFFNLILASRLYLYFHTLRYLKPRQIYWRLWYKIAQPRLDLSPQPSLRSGTGHWVVNARRRQSLEDCDKFNFLNQTGRLSKIGWDGPEREKLWRYNQHYFDDLNAENSDVRSDWHEALIKSWLFETRQGQGTGWEPYPMSLRLVNWVKWQLNGHTLDDMCLHSLAIQARFLSHQIEWHLLGNHIFANAKALVFAGLFFNGPEARKWLDIGLNIITEELPEQVLPDGGNFERSPMYHAIFLEDILDLINLANLYPTVINREQVDHWRAIAIKMLKWLETMCHPDGEISFFNDAAIGVAPSPSEIYAYASRLQISVERIDTAFCTHTLSRLADSGYIRLEALNLVALLDVAPIGPDYLPGHAHADTLSFEFSLFDERVFVNGGSSQYGNGPLRLEERGTAAHNTVEVDAMNSSEIWSGFRVARRAYPFDLEISQSKNTVFVTCKHNGFQHLSGNPIHKRSWTLAQESFTVEDEVENDFNSAVAFYHFHPKIEVTVIDEKNYVLRLSKSGREIRLLVSGGSASLKNGHYSPEFGKRLTNKYLSIKFDCKKKVSIKISWGSIDNKSYLDNF